MASPAAKKILIEDFGYQPVDIESKSAYSRAVKETIVKLERSKPNDPRIAILQDAVRPSKKTSKKKETPKKKETAIKKKTAIKKETPKKKETSERTAIGTVKRKETFLQAQKRKLAEQKAKSGFKGSESVKVKKDDAVKFITGKTPEPVEPSAPPMPKFGGEKTGAALASISQNVNAIKKLVTRQNKFEKDKADDTREVREKKKRSMAENLMEGGKKALGAVKSGFAKVLEPAKGIFAQIFDFLKLFVLGAGLMKLLDWFGNPENKSKIQSIFKFLKDWWPAIVAALIPFLSGIPLVIAVVALAVGFLPKIIDTVKMLFGFGKKVDQEISKNEKDLEKSDTDVKLDEKAGEDPPGQTGTEEKIDTTGAGEKPNVAEPQKFNQGGEVPGQGDKDTVPAMLTPGEFVLTKDAVKKYGTDTLYGMNAAAGGVDKSNDVPRGPSGKPMKKIMNKKSTDVPKGPSGKPMKKIMNKKSTVQTMMDNGGLNTINNISKSMSNVTNNTSKPMSNVTNNSSKSMSNITNNSSSDVTSNSMNMSDVTNKSSSNVTNNKSNVTNNIFKTMNMSGGGMTKNTSYMNRGGLVNNNISYMNKGGMTKNTSYMNRGGMTKNMSYMGDGGMTKNISYMDGGLVNDNISYMNKGGLVTNNNVDRTSNVQHMKVGGMIKNFISKTPQARLLKFAANQISKTPQARALRFSANQIKKSPVKPPVAKTLKALKGIGMKNTPPSPIPTEGGDSSVNEIPTFSVTAGGGRAKEQTLGIRR